MASRRKLVTAYRRLVDQAGVAAALRNWLQRDPDNSIARHLLSAQESETRDVEALPSRASDDYFRDVFDQFAETFNEQLQSLDYVRKTLERSGFSEISVKESVLRKEAGEEVSGLCWVARKSGSSIRRDESAADVRRRNARC